MVNLGRVAIVGFALAAFYLVPVRARDAGPSTRIVIGALVLAALTAMVINQLRSDQDRVGRLVMVLAVVVFGFALVFYSLAVGSPGQFSGLETRTDALYFTVVTITTIGYGDIYPVGQLARLLVVGVVLFDLVFITALASSIASRLRVRVLDRPREGSEGMERRTVAVERRVADRVQRTVGHSQDQDQDQDPDQDQDQGHDNDAGASAADGPADQPADKATGGSSDPAG